MNLDKLDNVCQALHVLGDWSCKIKELRLPKLTTCTLDVYWKGRPFISMESKLEYVSQYISPDNEEAQGLFRSFLDGMEGGGAYGVVHDFFARWKSEQRREFVEKCKDALTLMCLRLYAQGRNRRLCTMLDVRLMKLEKELD